MQQRSDEWLIARCGSLGASTIGKALERLKPKKGEESAARSARALDFMYELAAERLTHRPTKWVNPRDWGNEHEDEGRGYYANLTNAEVRQEGLIPHPTIPYAHASPDGLVGEDGGLEIKCPTSATHLKTLLDDAVPEEHLPQIYWNMACAGPSRRWWDFVSYDPRFIDPDHRFFRKRVERNDIIIGIMESDAVAFLTELNGKLEALRERYP